MVGGQAPLRLLPGHHPVRGPVCRPVHGPFCAPQRVARLDARPVWRLRPLVGRRLAVWPTCRLGCGPAGGRV